MRRLLDLGVKIIELGGTLIGDAIDEWTSGESREALYGRIREAADRGAELALENAQLHEQVDSLRFNGPTLWKEEVELLEQIASTMRRNIEEHEGFDETLKMLGRNLQIVQALLDRCDHMPMTSQEMNEQVDDVINGRVKTYSWDDIGKDVDGPEYGHDNPPPGYAKCTRSWPHTGPCAHPLKNEEGWDDIPF